MKKEFALLIFIIISLFFQFCNTTEPPENNYGNGLDTSSHLINWLVEDIGEYGSILRDVAIINDTLVYAVGEIHRNDTLYNLAKWDGIEWELKKASVEFRGNLVTPVLEGIFTFSETEIWLIGSLPIFGDGTNWTMYDLRTTVDPNISVSKAWGSNNSSIYFVGRGGANVRVQGWTLGKFSRWYDCDINGHLGKSRWKYSLGSWF